MTVVSSNQTYETPAPVAERIVEAAASLIASQGLHATSVDDIAAAAGCGRATVYRWYPGGRAELLDVTLDRGVDLIFDECARRIVGAPSLTEAAAITVNVAVLWLADDAVVQQLLADAPDTFASLISPMRLEPLLERAAQFGLDHFCRFTDPLTAAWAGEWCARVVTDHLRSPAPVVDLTDPAISRRFAESFLVPPSPVQ